MKNLYCVAKGKSDIIGFWKDDKGKIFRDKIFIKDFFNDDYAFIIAKRKLFAQGEKVVFYTEGSKAFIENREGKIDFLKHKITWQEKKLKPSFIKLLLSLHNGITIYRKEKTFLIELWKA
jgi:hypothetical protein